MEDGKMTKILHVSCSPRGQASESYRLSQKIIGFLLKKEPTAILVTRVLGGSVIANVDKNYAISQSSSADVSEDGSMARSEELIRELESSDFVVIGTPMHNLTVPAALKAWIDHVVRARRTFNMTAAGKVGTLRDRPVFIAISSGGRFSGEPVHQPDFLTPYLTTILGMIGLHDLTFFSVQGTGSAPDKVAETRSNTDQALQDYFSSFSAELREPIDARQSIHASLTS
ncbi:FMN-dependent NADH-azoreductase [Rhizobium tubonense]|nr:NAD(P)H-dependent oxidoreductase [Rhizobium tubonense]